MRAPRLDLKEALAIEAEHLLDCIRTGTRPRADGHAGLRTVRILEAAQLSIARGSTPIALPHAPQKASTLAQAIGPR